MNIKKYIVPTKVTWKIFGFFVAISLVMAFWVKTFRNVPDFLEIMAFLYVAIPAIFADIFNFSNALFYFDSKYWITEPNMIGMVYVVIFDLIVFFVVARILTPVVNFTIKRVRKK